MEFQVGDLVYVNNSAQEDVGTVAWQFIRFSRSARVKGWALRPTLGTKENNEVYSDPSERDRDYAVEWPVDFRGGHTCLGLTAAHRGQWIGGQHLELCFEASREVNTVPNIQGYDAEDTKENKL